MVGSRLVELTSGFIFLWAEGRSAMAAIVLVVALLALIVVCDSGAGSP